MNGQTLRRSFVAFHVTLGVVVAIESILTVLRASGAGGDKHLNVALACLAGAEAVAAVLFLVPATLKAGALALLAIFAFAVAFHGLHGEFQSTLLVYAAGVVLVMAHGGAFTGGGGNRLHSAHSA
jgi:hypothetical protein